MLRVSAACMGRWSSRDFMRGRSKRAGAVHTRHTHGRKGRYKRLSSIFSSVRDGRRHAENHTQGGLGVKIGGGLFGLRIPRQHQLSHMSKEDYDLEVYGHPNITNPYREYLDEHPDLQSVMMNASLAVTMVVLMPRVPRRSVSTAAAEGEGSEAPLPWRAVVKEVHAALAQFANPSTTSCSAGATPVSPPHVVVHFATVETSVSCQWPPKPQCPPLSSPSSSSPAVSMSASSTAAAATGDACDAEMQRCVAELYRAHCATGTRLELVKDAAQTTASSKAAPLNDKHSPAGRAVSRAARDRRGPLATFMGAALKAPVAATARGAASGSTASFTSSVLAQLTRSPSATPLRVVHEHRPAGGVDATPEKGVLRLVQRLSATELPLLRVCVRPAGLATQEASPPREAAAPTRRVLKSEIDPNADVGVWGQSASPLGELLRWHYCAHDPRAHNHDALPHHRRALPLLMVVDVSTCRAAPSARTASAPGAATLMPRRLSADMESAGFKLVKETSLVSLGAALAEWSPAAQWERYAGVTGAAASCEKASGADVHASL